MGTREAQRCDTDRADLCMWHVECRRPETNHRQTGASGVTVHVADSRGLSSAHYWCVSGLTVATRPVVAL
jgi:hypothetical protein